MRSPRSRIQRIFIGELPLNASILKCVFFALLGLGTTSLGCYGHGGACAADEAAGSIEEAKDLGSLGPAFTAVRGELVAQGHLQSLEDEDWYQFEVKDAWYIRWRPEVSLLVFPEPGSGHSPASFAVNVYNQDGEFIGEASEGLKLYGSAIYDDTQPYYVQIRWAQPRRSVAKSCVNMDTTPTPTATEGAGDVFSPTPPVSSPTPDAATPDVIDPALGDCTRYVLRIRN